MRARTCRTSVAGREGRTGDKGERQGGGRGGWGGWGKGGEGSREIVCEWKEEEEEVDTGEEVSMITIILAGPMVRARINSQGGSPASRSNPGINYTLPNVGESLSKAAYE